MPTFPTPRSAYYGNPATPGHQPDKADLVRLIEQTQTVATTQMLTGFVGAFGSLPTSSNTTGDTYAVMTADSDGGVYEWSGSAWVKISALPVTLTVDEFAIAAAESAAEALESENNALESENKAETARTQAELAATAAGAKLYDTIANGLSGTIDGDVFLVSTEPGVQVYRNDTGSETFLGWLGRVEFDDVASLIASTVTFTDGTIIGTREEGFAYRKDSTATEGFIENSATTPQKLVLLSDASGFKNVMGLSTDPDTAFSRLTSGSWVVTEDISLSGDTSVDLDDFSLETRNGATITVGGGTDRLRIHGDRTGTGKRLKLFGRLSLGGPISTDRRSDCFAGRLEIETTSPGTALAFLYTSNLQVSEPWDVNLTGTDPGNNGVSFVILKEPQLAGGTVRGNVSLGYSYVGNGTVAEPNIDGGHIGPMFTVKNDDYEGVDTGEHGHYCKGCRNVTFDLIHVTGNGANAWGESGNEYHIKLRDNQHCTFGRLIAIDESDPFRLGLIFVTSDGNSLFMNKNEYNHYENVFGKMTIFQTSPGETNFNTVCNLYGLIIASTAGSGNQVSGRIVFPQDTITSILSSYEFVDADVRIPAFTVSDCHFSRSLKAVRTRFHQKVKVFNKDIHLMENCRVEGDLQQDSSAGSYTVNLNGVTCTGDLITNTAGSRTVTANINNSSFAGDEKFGNSEPTTKNFNSVSFGNRSFASTVSATVFKSYTVSSLPSAAASDAGSVAYVSDGRKAGEGAGDGTGVMAFHDGSNWIAFDSGVAVEA